MFPSPPIILFLMLKFSGGEGKVTKMASLFFFIFVNRRHHRNLSHRPIYHKRLIFGRDRDGSVGLNLLPAASFPKRAIGSKVLQVLSSPSPGKNQKKDKIMPGGEDLCLPGAPKKRLTCGTKKERLG